MQSDALVCWPSLHFTVGLRVHRGSTERKFIHPVSTIGHPHTSSLHHQPMPCGVTQPMPCGVAFYQNWDTVGRPGGVGRWLVGVRLWTGAGLREWQPQQGLNGVSSESRRQAGRSWGSSWDVSKLPRVTKLPINLPKFTGWNLDYWHFFYFEQQSLNTLFGWKGQNAENMADFKPFQRPSCHQWEVTWEWDPALGIRPRPSRN